MRPGAVSCRFEQEPPPLDVVLADAPGRALGQLVSLKELRGGVLVLQRAADLVIYGIERGGHVVKSVEVERNTAGIWAVARGGDCIPRLLDGATYAEHWALVAAPRPDATALEISYTSDDHCTYPMFDHADVRFAARVVEVAVYLRDTRQLPAGLGCAGSATSRTATVQLGRPLGARRLLDAGFVPPQPIEPAP